MAPMIKIAEENWGRASRLLDAGQIPYEFQTFAQPQPRASVREIRGEDYILLDREHQKGNYSKLDLLFPFEKTHLDASWFEVRTPILLEREGGYMAPPRGFVDFLRLIKSGKAFDGNGRLIKPERLRALGNEITAVRSPYRSEWLDVQYRDGTMQYHSIKKDGTVELVTEPLEPHLSEDKTPGISLRSWIRTANNQGLPTKKTGNGRLHYFGPRNGAVAGFYAYSGWAGLSCGGDPAGSGASPGVRVVRAKK